MQRMPCPPRMYMQAPPCRVEYRAAILPRLGCTTHARLSHCTVSTVPLSFLGSTVPHLRGHPVLVQRQQLPHAEGRQAGQQQRGGGAVACGVRRVGAGAVSSVSTSQNFMSLVDLVKKQAVFLTRGWRAQGAAKCPPIPRGILPSATDHSPARQHPFHTHTHTHTNTQTHATPLHPPLKVLCGMRYSGTFSARSVTLSLPMARASAWRGGAGVRARSRAS